jgi:predicted ATPase
MIGWRSSSLFEAERLHRQRPATEAVARGRRASAAHSRVAATTRPRPGGAARDPWLGGVARLALAVLTRAQILDRLADRFALLTGGGRAALARHQTLRTTIDWSYDLLLVAEQMLVRRLCVFAGRFTLETVESVCTSGDLPRTEAFDVLSSLVDKSLVIKEDFSGRACYRLHKTVRE